MLYICNRLSLRFAVLNGQISAKTIWVRKLFERFEREIYMKKMLFSATALIVLSSVAFAADLPSKKTAPVMAAPLLAFSWTGAYVGADFGYDWGHSRTVDVTGYN